MRIRHAVPEDVPGILWLIQVQLHVKIMLITSYLHLHSNTCVWQLLAEYEKEPHKPKLKKEGREYSIVNEIKINDDYDYNNRTYARCIW